MAKRKEQALPQVTLPPITETDSGKFWCKVYLYTDEAGRKIYESVTEPTYNLCLERAMKVLLQAKVNRDEIEAEKREEQRNPTVSGTVRHYINSKAAVLSPTTVVGYNRTLKDWIMPFVGDTKIEDLNSDRCQKFINELSAGHSPKTVHNAWGLMQAAVLQSFPSKQFRVTLPRDKKDEVTIPTEDEMQRLYNRCRGTDIELPVYLASCCGLRLSEICGLQWKNIDLTNQTIHVCQAKVRGTEGMTVKGTKTVAGDRTIRMYPFILEIIKKAHNDRRPSLNDFVVSTPYNTIQHHYRVYKNEIGFKHTFHALRHYCVSVMLSLNIPKNYIADYVGHETENMIDAVYGHIMASKKTEVEDKMQDYFSKFNP